MAKRFITTDIFKDAWFMDLPNKYKLFWVFLLTDCSHAGIWQVNYKVASFYVGDHLEPIECERNLRDRIIKVEEGKYWFIPKFIEFQYGRKLSSKNKAVSSVIDILIEADLLRYLPDVKVIKGASKPQPSSLEGVKEKDKDKDKEIDKEECSTVIQQMFIRTLGRNPRLPEAEETEKLIQKFGEKKVERIFREAALRNIKSLQYILDNINPNTGELKPFIPSNSRTSMQRKELPEL